MCSLTQMSHCSTFLSLHRSRLHMPTCLKRLSITCLLIKHCNSSRVCACACVCCWTSIFPNRQMPPSLHWLEMLKYLSRFVSFSDRFVCMRALCGYGPIHLKWLTFFSFFFFHFVRWFVRLRWILTLWLFVVEAFASASTTKEQNDVEVEPTNTNKQIIFLFRINISEDKKVNIHM